MQFGKYINTVVYIKPIQLFWRLKLPLNRMFLQLFPPGIKFSKFQIPDLSLINNKSESKHYQLFEEYIDLKKIDWHKNRNKLKKYHLHYFDFLENCNKESGQKIINKWIDENPPSTKNDGWEPYPLSLRIVNWIFFLSRFGINPDRKTKNSLYLQGKWLYHQRELHLQANHFLKNIVALLFWGYCFSDKKMIAWARRNLKQQLDEQFTDSGYHYEFVPTYHVLSINDILDCYNLIKNNIIVFDNKLKQEVQKVLYRGLASLDQLSINGQWIPVADVNYQDCPGKEQTLNYAEKIAIEEDKFDKIQHKYFPAIRTNKVKIMIVNTPFSPAYNPGHSHQDKLSVMLWYANKPVLIDPGNYTYEDNQMRYYTRSVNAHNTIKIDNLEQAETWSSFRLGYRGKVLNNKLSDNKINISYLHKKYKHTRILKKTKNILIIKDIIQSPGDHSYKQFFHFNPDLDLDRKNKTIIVNNSLKFSFYQSASLQNSWYFPEMYRKIKNTCAIVEGDFTDSCQVITEVIPLS